MKPQAYSYIRFSTPEQLKGDSLRRQTEYANQVADKLGMKLDTSLNLRDLGVSGFTGEHRTKGALGEFLNLVAGGKIVKGSVLIIEELDRLSRESLLEAVNLMTSILLKDIGIYTGADDQHYNKDSFDVGRLVLSAYKLQAGHEESAKKSRRLKSAWKEKRAQAANGGIKLTAMSPFWLKPIREDDDKEKPVIGFDVLEEQAEAVRLIFDLKSQGMGNTSITKHLNKDTDIWKPEKSKRNKKGGWRESTIQKVIHNRAVLGEFQLHKKIEGKRQPVGEPIKDYYPDIVKEDTFHSVHNRLQRFHEKNGHPGGRTGKASNIFSRIIKCGKCGSPVHYINKGNGKKVGTSEWLRCDTSRLVKRDEDGNRICDAKAVPYVHFRDIFLHKLGELDYSTILPDPDEVQIKLNKLNQTIEANQNRIRELQQEVSNLSDSIASTESKNVRVTLETRLDKAITDREILLKENEKLETGRKELHKQGEEIKESINKVEAIRKEEKSKETEAELIDLRTRLRGAIQKLVRQIDLYPLEEPYKRLEELEEEPGIFWYMESQYVDRFRVLFTGSQPDTPLKSVFPLKKHRVTGEHLWTGGVKPE